MDFKTKKILMFFLAVGAWVLETLPYGAALNFANPEGEPWHVTYSYFDPILVGYANFGPFVAAILTCVLIVLTAIGLFNSGKRLNVAVAIVSAIAAALSLSPALYGADYITAVGVTITLLLLAVFGMSFVSAKER